MEIKKTIVRTPKTSWPFADHERVRLELVYGLKVSKGGRGPTTKAVFRKLSSLDKELALLEMDWLSLPRLTPGRVFEASPHISDGTVDGDRIWIDIPSNQKIEVLTLRDAQTKLNNETLLEVFRHDSSLPETRVFHWTDSMGHEYWLPVLELIRKMFVRSPELARSIIMYQGLDELIWDSSIRDETLHITFTKHIKIGDIPLLSLISSKSSLLAGWNSVARHLPKASDWVAIDLPWFFDEDVSITAISKTTSSTHWIQEILDIRGFSIPFKRIAPIHPNYIFRTVDEAMQPRQTRINRPDATEPPEITPSESTDDIILEPAGSRISRPKKYIHVQGTSLSELNKVEIDPSYIEKKESLVIAENKIAPSHQESSPSIKKMHGHLSDNVSSRLSPADTEEIGVGVKESQNMPQWNGLEKFIDAMNQAVKELGKNASLSWIVPGTALEKPKDTGSRWFLKTRNGKPRAWCLAKISFESHDFYFLEVGRDKDKRFSLSTLFIQNTNPEKASDWIKEMITNNGHWNREALSKGMPGIEFLPHKQKSPSNWGLYFARKIHTS